MTEGGVYEVALGAGGTYEELLPDERFVELHDAIALKRIKIPNITKQPTPALLDFPLRVAAEAAAWAVSFVRLRPRDGDDGTEQDAERRIQRPYGDGNARKKSNSANGSQNGNSASLRLFAPVKN